MSAGEGTSHAPPYRYTDYQSRGLRLRCHEWGQADRPPVMLLHGGRDHAQSWCRIATALADRFWVIAPDLAGHGDSDWSGGGGYRADLFVFDILSMYAARGLKQVAILAHSMGGNIAMRLAASYPEYVSRIAALEGLGYKPSYWSQFAVPDLVRDGHKKLALALERPPREFADLADCAKRLRQVNPQLDEAFALELAALGTRRTTAGGWAWKVDPTFVGMSIREWRSESQLMWRAVQCPVLLLTREPQGEYADPLHDELLSIFPNARCAAIAARSHWLHHDNPQAVLAHVRPFLEEGAPAATMPVR